MFIAHKNETSTYIRKAPNCLIHPSAQRDHIVRKTEKIIKDSIQVIIHSCNFNIQISLKEKKSQILCLYEDLYHKKCNEGITAVATMGTHFIICIIKRI